MSPAPIWTIDQSDQGQYYVKPQSHGQSHNSDSLGEGIVSLLFIVDALYDSQPGDFIAIDEPELSLHPAYQRRLATLLANYALDRQILYATHSPYFVDFKNVINGAEVARVHKSDGGSVISQLNRNTAQRFQGVLNDTHNPHVLGLDAREAFFQEDGVVVVEGQEDVVYYPRTLNQLVDMGRMNCADADYVRDRFFGWGAGGADNIERIVELLSDLGFERVAAILDLNKSDLICDLRGRFPGYTSVSIPADDVRTKPASIGRAPTNGLLDDNGELRPVYVEGTCETFSTVVEGLREGRNKHAAVLNRIA